MGFLRQSLVHGVSDPNGPEAAGCCPVSRRYPVGPIEDKIHFLRGHKVILSMALAALYGVQPRVLIQAVKRNGARFPQDFMFQLTRAEFANLKSRFVTSSWGGLRKSPYAFTEQGVAMLSSVLNSERAIKVNIAIMRAFVKMRQLALTREELAARLQELEKSVEGHDAEIKNIIRTIEELLMAPDGPKRILGFREKAKSPYGSKRAVLV